MNINLEQPLFRFVVPPSIFCAILASVFSDAAKTFSGNPFLFVIAFVALGFVLSAMGTGIARLVDLIFQPVWVTPLKEMEYWLKIDEKNEYFQKKIENVWGFYSMNVNSCISIFSATLLLLAFSKIECPVILALFSFFILFFALAWFSYRKLRKMGAALK